MRRVLVVGVAALIAGCGGSSHHQTPTSATAAPQTVTPTNTTPAPAVRLSRSLRLSSPAFRANAKIPKLYTCDGKDVSLPLRWTGVPQGTRELVLVMRDPDAPGGSFVHWALAGIAPAITTLPAGAPPPAGAVEGANSFGSAGYRGPCPPPGDRPHHYVLTLSALGSPSHLRSGFSPDQLRTGALAIATLVGIYSRR